jgi:ABC-2 type transport system permease protein
VTTNQQEGGTALGAVYDRGYRPYEGPRGGRWASVGALWRASMRRALGLRRSWRQKIAPWALLAVVSVPAVVWVGLGYLTRNTPTSGFEFITYRQYVGVSSALVAFVAITAPDIMCPDRRNRVLLLIFARPIDGAGYVLAKVGAIVALVFSFGFIPQVVLFAGRMLIDDSPLGYLRDNLDVVWKVPVAVAALAFYYGTFGLALASLTSRRIVAGVSFIGVLLVSNIIAAVIRGPEEPAVGLAIPRPTAWSVIDLLVVPLHVRDLVFLGYVDPIGTLADVPGAGAMVLAVWAIVVGGSLAVLLWRYRSPEAS